MRALVDQDLCVGCGLCADICPDAFELGYNGKAEEHADTILPAIEDLCREAVEACPVEAIQIHLSD